MLKPAVWTILILLASPAWAQIGGFSIPGQAPDINEQPTAQVPDEPVDPVDVSTAWSAGGAAPGQTVNLAVVLDVAERWKVNANPAAPGFIATEVRVTEAPSTVQFSTPIFPEPHRIPFDLGDGEQSIPVYDGQVVIYLPMAVAGNAEPGTVRFSIDVTYQACETDGVCLFPVTRSLELELPIVADRSAIEPRNAELFAGLAEARSLLTIPLFGFDFEIDPRITWLLLLIAAAGGALLNFTPCVLPLIPIKIMSLSQAAGNRARCLMLGLTMSAGVVTFWLMLGVVIAFVAGFTAANQLFQYPWFTIGIGLLIAVMGVAMGGLLSMQLPQWIYRINPRHDTWHGSLGFGIMAAVLSTPCTAPFMGAAAGWAATQTPWITMSTFTAIGVGMALPYALLSAFPQLVERMPRTGPASELIKQVMGLAILAAAAYFVGTGVSGLLASPPDPPSRAYWWVVGLFIAAAGAWLAWRTMRITPRLGRRIGFGGLGVVMILAGALLGFGFTASSPINWVYYTPQRLAEAQAQGKVVVLEFTAEWCLNCHTLEQAVLHRPQVVRLLNADDVAPIKIDLTGNNAPGNAKLTEVGRRTIPLLIVYDRQGTEVFRSDAYTQTQVIQAVQAARQG